MKIFSVVIIVGMCGVVGYNYKSSITKKLELLKLLRKYTEFVESNLTLFKTDLLKINNKFIIMQKNKNAECLQNILNNTTLKSNNTYFYKVIKDKDVCEIIISFMSELGKGEYDFEIEKINRFLLFLNKQITKCEDDVKNKGDLFFKLSLAVGAVLGVCIW